MVRTDLTRALEAWSSQGLHRVLMLVVLPCGSGWEHRASTIGGSVHCGDHFGQRAGVDDTGYTQRAPEGAATLRERKASQIRVQVCAPARPSASRVGQHTKSAGVLTDRDKPQQLGG
jgi:hypothetical protein